MRRVTTSVLLISAAAGLLIAGLPNRVRAGCTGCTGGCQECVPACRGTWEEKTSTKPVYTMKCEYACTRAADAWHAPSPECRCHPPCGNVIVKKRFFKSDGPEHVERVPKYEVRMMPAQPRTNCDHASGHESAWWNPLAMLRRCGDWW